MEDLEKAGSRIARGRRKKPVEPLGHHETAKVLTQTLQEHGHLLDPRARKQLEEARDNARKKAGQSKESKPKSDFDPDKVAQAIDCA